MLRLLVDENFNSIIIRGVQAIIPDLDFVTIQWLGLERTPDPAVLDVASAQDRVLITHDWRTMPTFAYERLAAGRSLTGVVIIPSTMHIREAIDEVAMVVICTENADWKDQVVRLPL